MKHLWWLGLLTVVLAAACDDGGPRPVGAVCKRATDCLGEVCIQEDGTVSEADDEAEAEGEVDDDETRASPRHIPDSTFHRGMCTKKCDDDDRCGKFERCVETSGAFDAYCVPVCNREIACRPRYSCRELGAREGDPFGFCWPIDSAAQPQLWIEPERFSFTTESRPGQGCDSSVNCADRSCLHRLDPRRADSIEFPLGFCARSCTATSQCAGDIPSQCATIPKALRDSESINLCLWECTTTPDCRPEYQCVQLGKFGGPFKGVCWPATAAPLPEPVR